MTYTSSFFEVFEFEQDKHPAKKSDLKQSQTSSNLSSMVANENTASSANPAPSNTDVALIKPDRQALTVDVPEYQPIFKFLPADASATTTLASPDAKKPTSNRTTPIEGFNLSRTSSPRTSNQTPSPVPSSAKSSSATSALTQLLKQSAVCAIPAASAAGGISLVNRSDNSAFVTQVRPTNKHLALLERNYDPAKFLNRPNPQPTSSQSNFFKPVLFPGDQYYGAQHYDEHIASMLELEQPNQPNQPNQLRK